MGKDNRDEFIAVKIQSQMFPFDKSLRPPSIPSTKAEVLLSVSGRHVVPLIVTTAPTSLHLSGSPGRVSLPPPFAAALTAVGRPLLAALADIPAALADIMASLRYVGGHYGRCAAITVVVRAAVVCGMYH